VQQKIESLIAAVEQGKHTPESAFQELYAMPEYKAMSLAAQQQADGSAAGVTGDDEDAIFAAFEKAAGKTPAPVVNKAAPAIVNQAPAIEQFPEDIRSMIDGKTPTQITKTIELVEGLNPERANQLKAYLASKQSDPVQPTGVPEVQEASAPSEVALPQTPLPPAKNRAGTKATKPKLRNFFTEIKEAGGINLQSLIEATDRNQVFVRTKDKNGKEGLRNRFIRITSVNGRGVDDVARAMYEQGWPVPLDIDGNVDSQAFADMIMRHGEVPVTHPDNVQQQAEEQYMAEEAARIEAELRAKEDAAEQLPDDVLDGKIEAAISQEDLDEALSFFDQFGFGENNEAEQIANEGADRAGTGEENQGDRGIGGETGTGSPEGQEAKPLSEVVSTSGEVQNKLFATAPKFGTKPQTKGSAVGTSSLMDSFTSEESVQPDIFAKEGASAPSDNTSAKADTSSDPATTPPPKLTRNNVEAAFNAEYGKAEDGYAVIEKYAARPELLDVFDVTSQDDLADIFNDLATEYDVRKKKKPVRMMKGDVDGESRLAGEEQNSGTDTGRAATSTQAEAGTGAGAVQSTDAGRQAGNQASTSAGQSMGRIRPGASELAATLSELGIGANTAGVATGTADLAPLEEVFGKRVVWFAPSAGVALPRGMFNPAFPDLIFINTQAHDPALRIFGHELIHALRNEAPDLYKRLKQIITTDAAFDDITARYPELTEDNQREELYGDLVADRMLDKGFWSNLERKSPALFRAAARFIQSVIGRIRTISPSFYTKDIKKADKIISGVMLEYAERKGQSVDKLFYGDGTVKLLSAYHGSPHDFDRFSTDAIGTGEGAQAYGYGLYFAGSREVAEYYRDTLSGSRSGRGLPIRDTLENAFPGREFDDDERSEIFFAAARKDGLTAKQVQNRKASLRDVDTEKLQEVIEKLRKQARGRLYQVELAPEPDEYLLWDKPLSEQSEKVKAALEGNEHLLKRYADIDSRRHIYTRPIDQIKDMQGQELYENVMAANLGSDKAASEYLHSLGIRGIKYLDGTSRGKGEGNYNYVIFSDDDVSIEAKFSLAPPAPTQRRC